MKICLLTTSYPSSYDGTKGIFVKTFSEQLSSLDGVSLKVVTEAFKETPRLEQHGKITIKRFYYLPKKYSIIGSEPIIKTIQKPFGKFHFFFFMNAFIYQALKESKDCDLIQSHWFFPTGFAGAIASKLSKKPHVITLHAADVFLFYKIPFFRRKLADFIVKHADFITCQSNHVKQELVHLLSSEMQEEFAKKHAVIQMGIDTHRFQKKDKKALRKKYKLPLDAKIILSVGRLSEKKGLNYLIDVVPSLIKKHKNILVLIIGGGELEHSLKKYVQQKSLDKVILFLGPKLGEELVDYYNIGDVCVFPSIVEQGDTEGLPSAVLEAMSTGLPVIGSDVGGMSDGIFNNYNGYLVPQKSTQELVERLIFFFDHSNIQKKLSQNAYTFIREKVSWDITKQKFHEIYQMVYHE